MPVGRPSDVRPVLSSMELRHTEGMDSEEIRAFVDVALADGNLTEAAAKNLRLWLDRPLFSNDTECIREHVRAQRWSDLELAFWTTIPFGTAGRRGRMYPIGSAAINRRTMAETVQALADYLRDSTDSDGELRCAIAYDCRHRSRAFADLAAEILLAADFTVYFHDAIRSTPQLAFAVRHWKCNCGIMISASHNPPADNAIKVFWSNGGQLTSPHDTNIATRMQSLAEIQRATLESGAVDGRLIVCTEESDDLYRQAVLRFGEPRQQTLRIVYSSLHGVGATSIPPVLKEDGFVDVELFALHAEPNGDFPNVPDQIANPENPAVFDAISQYAAEVQADMALASDPDADRIGCSGPLHFDNPHWKPLTGNQIGVLLGDTLLKRHANQNRLSKEHFVITTVVSSEMLLRLAESYGVRGFGNVLTGFKWIGHQIDLLGADKFLFGYEEAHGYLIGNFIRDKDAAGAAMILAERAAEAKSKGLTLLEELDNLYRKHGLFDELTIAKRMTGPDGVRRMQQIMRQLRENPPTSLAKQRVTCIRDYREGTERLEDGTVRPCALPQSDLLVLQLSQIGFRAAVRPSGTEPKIKFYLFAHRAADALDNLEIAKEEVRDELHAMHDDLMKAVGLSVELA